MTSHRRSVGLVGLLLIFAVTGCTAESEPAKPVGTASAGADFVSVVDPAWSVSADMVGDPATDGEFVTSYVAMADGALNVVVWNAESGSEVWRDVASVGYVTQGVQVDVETIESEGKSFVTYLSPVEDSNGWQRLVVAELASGMEIGLSNDHVWPTSRPSECADGENVCFTGWLEADPETSSATFRADFSTGMLVRDADVVMAPDSRALSDRVFATQVRPPEGVEEVGYSSGGKVQWQVPYEDIFGPGYSSDGGWDWEMYESDEVIVGSGYTYDRLIGVYDDRTIDLTARKVVGLNVATGEVLWSQDGIGYCAASVIDAGSIDDIIPLCRYNSGSTAIDRSEDHLSSESVTTDLDIDLVGVDGESGEIKWTRALGDAEANLGSEAGYFATRAAERPINVEGEMTIVDVLSNETTDVPDDGIFSCLLPRDSFEAYSHAAESVIGYNAGADTYACSADLAATGAESYSEGAVRMGGVDAGGGGYVLGSATGLAWYDLAA
jgi:hypothetical protein